MSSNPTSFRLPSAYTIPTHIEHEGKQIALPTQIRDNVRMLFNGLLDAHQAIISLKSQLGKAGTTVVNNSITNTTVTGGAGASFTTSGQGYFFGPGIFLPISAITRSSGGSWIGNANVVYVIQFTLGVTIQVSKISMNVIGNALGKFAGFGIYSADGNTKIVDSAPMSLNSIAVVTSSITPVDLIPGVYNWAQTSDGVTGQINTSSSVATNDSTLMNANAGAPRYALATNGSVAGQLPATLGALTAVTPATSFDTALVMLEP